LISPHYVSLTNKLGVIVLWKQHVVLHMQHRMAGCHISFHSQKQQPASVIHRLDYSHHNTHYWLYTGPSSCVRTASLTHSVL